MSEDKKALEVIQRFKQLKTKRHPWEDVWDMISDFVSPNLGAQTEYDTQAQTYGEKMFDGTAADAARTFSDGLLGSITTPSGSWYRMAFEMARLKGHEAGTEWLQECEEVFGTIFTKSKFYDAMSKVFWIGITYGTATLYIDDDVSRNRINFSCRNPREIYIEPNEYDEVDTIFRHYKQSAKNIVRRWKGHLPKNFEEDAKSEPYKQYKIIHAVFPREDRDYYKIDKLNKPFASIYVLEDSQHTLSEGGFDLNPYIVWRYLVNSGEDYGRSPAWFALSDIKVSQQIMKTLLQAAHRHVDPPVQAPGELKGQINLTPNGITYFVDPNRKVEEIPSKGNYPIGKDMQEVVQLAIKRHFRTEFFLMWNNAMATKGSRTATEVMAMQGEQAATLSPIVSRIDSELLNPAFDRIFNISYRAQWLPEPPDEVIQYGGTEIKVDYVGPLAQAVKKHWDTQQINQTLIQTISLFDIWPEMRHRIDSKEMGRFLLESGGFPEKLIVDDGIYDQLVQADKDAQNQAMAQQDGLAQAEVYSKVAKAAEPNSLAESLL